MLHTILVIFILGMCNIHFIVKKNIEKQFNIKDEKSNSLTKAWVNIITYFKKLDLIEINKTTKYFDETMTLIYLLIIMSYIHYR